MAQHLVEGLRAVIARAEQLSESQQEALAIAWEAALEEQEWQAIVSKPSVRSALERLAAEARAEDAAGETEAIEGDRFV